MDKHAEEALDKELMALISQALPRNKAKSMTRTSVLRELGIDSLTLMIIVGRFMDAYHVDVAALKSSLGSIRIVEDLLTLGRRALVSARAGA